MTEDAKDKFNNFLKVLTHSTYILHKMALSMPGTKLNTICFNRNTCEYEMSRVGVI